MFSENPAIDAVLSHSVLATIQKGVAKCILSYTVRDDLLAEILSTCAPFKHLDLL